MKSRFCSAGEPPAMWFSILVSPMVSSFSGESSSAIAVNICCFAWLGVAGVENAAAILL
jgi:hypothetical protein